RIELDGEGHLKRTAGGAESSPDARLRPGDRTVMMPVPTAPADWHGWKHYSMEMNGRVEKMTKAEMVIGRHGLQADIAVSDPGVSRRHAAVKMTPEGAFIRDLGSTNGTYVNGVKVEGEVKLKPGDRITLGKDGPEIRWKHEPPPPKPEEFKLEIRGQKQPLKKSEVVLGRDPGKADVVMGDAGVSRQHAVVRTGSDGVYIKDLGSTNGTYVNGVKIEGEYKLKPGDRITLGKDGPEIKLHHEPPPELKVPRKPLEYRPHSSGLDPAAEAGSVKQSNEFLARHEVREKLRDGFQNVGGVNFIDQAGRFHDTVRPSTVVDRTQDEVLNRAIADAHRRFDRLRDNPQELAKALAQYSKELLEPRGWSGDAVDKGYYALRKEFAGKRVLLGEFIERAARGEGAGVCQHQALLFKVLGDEFGLDVSFVRGYSGTRPPKAGSQLNHAWNEVFIDGQRLVFDPRQQVFGVPYEKLAYHTPGRDMPWLVRKPPDVQPAQVADAAAGRTPPGDVPPPVEPPRLRPEVPQEAPRQLINLDAKAGDRIQYQGKSWRVEGYNGITGDVILIKGGYRPMGAQEFAELNPGRQLKVGERYRVRRSSGAIEEGWRLEGVNPDGSLRMFKEDASRIQVPRADIAEANPHLVRPEAPQPRLDQPMAKVGDANVRLDEKQIALRDQPVRLEGRQGGGNSGHDMYLGEVQMPDGSYKEVIFHNAHDLGDGSSKSAVRYRKEMAAYKLNEIIGLDNGFPLTAPRDAVIEGQPVRGWVQERAGDPIERRLRSLAHQRYGGRGSSEDVSRLVREDPHLKQQMEQAFVERLIYGDGDDHALNFVMRDTPQGPKIQNIDLDYAFPPDREPQWFLVGNEGINKRLKADFSEQQLSEATLKKIRDFVSTHDTPAGRQRLAGLGLKPGEVEGILARARWLADNRRFPKARTLKEYRADLEQRGGE
ncbi:MAG TPA: FHA domain-containing protein, partial [Candidatus Obscuribacterales bacterium]